jgi:hypothetical protein
MLSKEEGGANFPVAAEIGTNGEDILESKPPVRALFLQLYN